MAQQAPSLSTPIRIINLAANYINIAWDSIGVGYTYVVRRKLSSSLVWTIISPSLYTQTNFYDSGLLPNTEYDYSVEVNGPGLLPSQQKFLLNIKTFETNSYSISSAIHVRQYDNFLKERFELDSKDITTVGDIKFALMRPSYSFDSSHISITDPEVLPHLMIASSNIAVYGRAPNGCGGFGCSIPALYSNYILMFDRKQKIVRISPNKGKTWYAEIALTDRAADTYHEALYSHNHYGMFVLGMNTIMVVRDKNNIHWSDTGFHFSNSSVTFDDEYVTPDLQFAKFVDLPPALTSGEANAIGSDDDYVYIAAGNILYRCNIQTKVWECEDILPSFVTVKDFVTYNGKVYIFCPGLGGCDNWNSTSIAGIYEISSNWGSYTKIFGNTPEEVAKINPLFSNMSRDDSGILLGLEPQPYTSTDVSTTESQYSFTRDVINPLTSLPIEDKPSASYSRPFREILYITEPTDGVYNFDIINERWQYEEQYIYNGIDSNVIGYSAPRIRVNDTNMISVITAVQEYSQNVILDDSFNYGETTVRIDPNSITFIGFPGYTNGAILYNATSRKLICYNSLGVRTRSQASFNWLAEDIVVRGVLQTYVAPTIPPEEISGIPSLTPFTEKFLPEHYSYREPKFVDFVREYLKYISTGALSNYGQLYYLLKSHDANEKTAFIDMFETDLMRRNIYVTPDIRAQLNKFLYNTARDFYSLKGTVDSYKFLFRLLYGEHVEVKVENSYEFTYEFDILITHLNGSSTTSLDASEKRAIGQYISGQKAYQSDVETSQISDIPTYGEVISAIYKGDVLGQPRFTVRLINLYGLFDVGYAYESKTEDHTIAFTPYSEMIVVPNTYRLDDQDKQFNFILRLESELPTSRYYNDVINFVHPVGFDFIGSYLISSFVTSAIPNSHIETIIQYSDSVRWDNGIPSVYPDWIPDLLGDEYQFTIQWYMMNDGSVRHLLKVVAHPSAGLPINALSVDPNYYIDNPPEVTPPYGLTVDQRRTKASPLFDGSSGRFFERINNPDTNNVYGPLGVESLNRVRISRQRLKDNVLNSLDPLASQRRNPAYQPPS